MSAHVHVFEVFESIQGESSYAGLSCFFVRLAGCNLSCSYCDTTEARTAVGEVRDVTQIVAQARESTAAIVEITGGEPLKQDGFTALAKGLRDGAGKPVLVETNGSCDISLIPDDVVAVMDVKCPGSGESEAMDLGNVDRLRPYDEVKCVLCDRRDYMWAKELVQSRDLAHHCGAVFFTAAEGGVAATELGAWILADGLPVRVGVQLHKILGMK